MTLAAPLAIHVAAALAEIAGFFVRWARTRGQSVLWLVSGLVGLALFAWLLTPIDADFTGRAFAAYAALHILCSQVWMALVEAATPVCWARPCA